MCTARANHHTLTGLNDNFSVVKSQILLMDPLPPMNKVFSLVLQHERQGNYHITDESKALLNAARSKASSYHRSAARVCTFCGRDNHTVENCFKKHGLPPHLRKSSANNAALEGGIDDSHSSASENTTVASNASMITQEQAL
jgi:hypothetical protein